MKGKLYGIGVGPGDPDALTIKAKKVIDSCSTIAYPVKEYGQDSRALDIVKCISDLENKRILEVLFSMNPDSVVRKKCRKEAIQEIIDILDDGEDVAMITLGDVSIYSTYSYINQAIRDAGYDTEIVPGVPSFCYGAAKAGFPLTSGNETLAILPLINGTEYLDKVLDSFDNVVVMKPHNFLSEIHMLTIAKGIDDSNCTVFSNLGMPGEFIGKLDPEKDYGYLTTIFIKNVKGGKN